jgi:hypothetical protein
VEGGEIPLRLADSRLHCRVRRVTGRGLFSKGRNFLLGRLHPGGREDAGRIAHRAVLPGVLLVKRKCLCEDVRPLPRPIGVGTREIGDRPGRRPERLDDPSDALVVDELDRLDAAKHVGACGLVDSAACVSFASAARFHAAPFSAFSASSTRSSLESGSTESSSARISAAELPGTPGNLSGGHAFRLKRLEHPGHEEEIARSPLERTRARKHQISECVTDAREAQFVPRATLAEHLKRVKHAPAFRVRVVDPGE